MKTHSRVVVIGGGMFGCSIIYHLTKMGWSDVVLVEKGELTSGQTWHAVGTIPLFVYGLNLAMVHRYSVELYKQLEAETGQATGWHTTGSIRLGATQAELDAFKSLQARAHYLGIDFHIIGPDEVRSLHPFAEVHDVIAAAHTPGDGYADPASLAQALAKGARDAGAKIYRQTRVTDLSQTPSGEWEVTTDQGVITAEMVVNAAGCFSPEIGAMVGLDLPVMAVEHQYLVTDNIPEIEAYGKEFPVLRETSASYYLRREQNGLLFGPYETRGARPFAVDGMPRDFGQELLPDDLGRIQEWIDLGIKRVPLLGQVGVKRVVNGPQSFTPDGAVLLGPAPGLQNHWLACGSSAGITQGGGCGKYFAQWMVEGEAEIDMRQFDPRRFGPYADKSYALPRVIDSYHSLLAVHYPYEEREAGRPAITGPAYERLKARGAVFGEAFGLERANWFAPDGVERVDEPSFRRTNWFPYVGAECRAMRERVGVADFSILAKFEVSGAGAEAFLNHLCANTLPAKTGAIGLSHLLTERGGVVGEMVITRLTPERFYVLTAATARLHDFDWMTRRLPDDGSVVVEDVSMDYGVLSVAGPRSRDLLSKLTDSDLGNGAFPRFSAREITVSGLPVRALRISFVGELGWELHYPLENQLELYDALLEGGSEFGIADVGSRAVDSMRLEKAYRAFGTDLTTECTLIEAGLERLVCFDKGFFLGREALLERRNGGLSQKLVYLAVDAVDADCVGNEPVFFEDRPVGVVSSGGYGHAVEQSLAFAYVKAALATPETALEIDILGCRRPARVLSKPLHDPDNARLRA